MSSTEHGRQAEKAVGNYLSTQGYKIRDYNWRTRYCEIDIVAEKNDTVYFVEVKYRSTTNQGSGFEYVTPNKLRQMAFAAEMWVQANDWTGEYCLAAAEVIGQDYHVKTFIEL